MLSKYFEYLEMPMLSSFRDEAVSELILSLNLCTTIYDGKSAYFCS